MLGNFSLILRKHRFSYRKWKNFIDLRKIDGIFGLISEILGNISKCWEDFTNLLGCRKFSPWEAEIIPQKRKFVHFISPRTKNEIDSKNIYKNKGKIVGFFWNLDFSKNVVNFNGKKLVSTGKSVNFNLSIKFYDVHFIFIYNIFLESFSFVVFVC